jgi:hypothetical protein
MTPSISKSSKRKTNTKKSTAKGRKILKVDIPVPSVKKELPDIDLSAPMPPPSPSDDPLLLSGPILPPSSTPTRLYKDRQHKEIGVITSASLTQPLRRPMRPFVTTASSSPLDTVEGIQPLHWARHTDPDSSTDLSMMDMDEGVADISRFPLFDLNFDLPPSSDAGGCNDSDEDDHALRGSCHAEDREVVEGEGEYTGKWRMITLRTKLDPPSSATRQRMEEWGRPITPYPKRIAKLGLSTDVHGEDTAAAWADIEAPDDRDDTTDDEVRGVKIPPPSDGEGDREEQEVEQKSAELESQDLGPEIHDTAMQGPFDFDASFDDQAVDRELLRTDVAQQDELEDVSLAQTEESLDQRDDQLSAVDVNPGSHEEDDDDEEEREVRQMSVEFEEEEDLSVEECVASRGHNRSASLASFTSILLKNQESVSQSSPPGPSATQQPWFSRAVSSEGCADIDDEMAYTSLVYQTQRAQETFVTTEETPQAVDDDGSDDEVSSDSEDTSVVKITSADPRAAARAAAILKQVRLVLLDMHIWAYLICV